MSAAENEDLESNYMPLVYFTFLFSMVILFILFQRYNFGIVERITSITTIKLSDRPSTEYRQTEMPFTITLRDETCADVFNGLEFDIRCNDSCKLYILWGVQTNILARLTMGEGVFTTSYSTIEDMFIGHSISHKGPIWLSYKSQHRLIALPEEGFDLGPPPRRQVPLVLLVTLGDHDVFDSDIITLVTVIHIKDKHCTDVTSKLNEVINLRNGHWIPLYKYYSSGDSTTDFCVVCRDNRVTRILLPCRHACLCDSCLTQLSELCPMCRCVVTTSAVI